MLNNRKFTKCVVTTCFLVATTLSLSCNKEESAQTADQERPYADNISVSIDGTIDELTQEDGMKSELTNPIKLIWTETDKVYAFDDTRCLGVLDVMLEDGRDSYAVLSGEILAPQGNVINLVYSSELNMSKGAALKDGTLSFDLSRQNGLACVEPFVAYATIEYTPGRSEIKGIVADFELANSIIRLNCSHLERETEINRVRIKGISNQCLLQFSSTGVSVKQGSIGDIILEMNEVSTNVNGTKALYASLARTGAGCTAYMEITQGDECFECSIDKFDWQANKAYNIVCPMKKSFPYVVIGNLKWATCNVGASKPQEYGYYFMYGDTKGYVRNAANTAWVEEGTSEVLDGGFVWKNAPFNNGSQSFNSAYFSKIQADVCPDYELVEDYDAAHIHMGGNWRMPTNEEYQAMFNACTFEWKSIDGVYGRLYTVISEPDKTLFFPAGGYGTGTNLSSAGALGYYWTSTLATKPLSKACSLAFSSKSMKPATFSDRYLGLSIRAVAEF